MRPRSLSSRPGELQEASRAKADRDGHPAPRVLIVDDDFAIADAIAELLRDAGYEVEHAGDGEEGLEAMRARRPELVLLDFMMPRFDGLQVLQEMRQTALTTVPVILMTAASAALPPAAVRGVPVLGKPFASDALLQLVAQHAPAQRLRAVS